MTPTAHSMEHTRQRVRRSAIVLSLLAAGIYLGFILLSIVK